jgi:hypothetical protein
MPDPVEIAFQNPEELAGALTNSAVARCCAAGARTYSTVLAKRRNTCEASRAAHEAFRRAMPPLSGADNIRDFIACVAHGMLIESIGNDVGARLLYAAQVASGACRSTAAKTKPAA